ncbi:Nif3-like dinuclear metal center hexameric protein [Mycoplasma simbae]|uniref:Nif3-like dinuclear metal center hexameric protein n=1 Tax=Mycoplasma simbae TaxID=36744 RepID=UPI00049844BF|nr:Nif3-like dinuclear metal center hexameric protein [Mycoplasma simbae]
MQIKKVTSFLLGLYPLSNAEEWDPVGFAPKFALSETIKGAVVAIDLTTDVLQQAIKSKANLIIVHHPFRFAETWQDEFKLAPYKKKIYEQLKKYRISVLALHTNYDNNTNGTSHQIAKKLGFGNSIVSYKKPYPSVVEAFTGLSELKMKFEHLLNLKQMRTNVNDTAKKYRKIAFLSGSGGADLAYELSQNKVELIITSDIKWNEWLLYREHNIDVLEVSHLDEQVFVHHICQQLSREFNDLSIIPVLMQEPYKNF